MYRNGKSRESWSRSAIIDKLDFIKISAFWKMLLRDSKDKLNKDWEKLFAKHLCDKNMYPKYTTEIQQNRIKQCNYKMGKKSEQTPHWRFTDVI